MLEKYNGQRIIESGDNSNFAGEITWGNGKLINIELEEYNHQDKHRASILWHLKDGRKITTLNNDIYNSYIYPQYLIQGHDLPDQYSGFLLRLSNVSEWLLGWSSFNMNDGFLSKEIPKEVFSVSVTKPDGVKLKISSAFQCSVTPSKTQQDITEVEEFYYIEVKYLTPQSIECIEKEAHHLRRLFSYILGSPLNTEKLVLTKEERQFQLVFTDSKTEGIINSPVDVIIDASYLSKDNRWEKVFQSFYQHQAHKRFKGIWSRYFGLMSHNGYWDYGIFGCVSLLEAYCSIHCGKIDESLPDNEFNAIIKAYEHLIDAHKDKSSNPLSVIFDGLKGLWGNNRNTKYPIFSTKFDKLIEDTPREVVESIGLTKTDFAHIKSIRDKVAHGGSPKTKDQRDISYEIKIENKLMVLMMYYLYRDLGFNQDDFIHFLTRRFNKILRSAYLVTERIDYFSSKIEFYEVDRDSFDQVNATNGHQLVFNFDHKNKSLIFNREISNIAKSDWPSSPSGSGRANLEMFVYDVACQKQECEAAGYLSHCYVTCGDENKEIWGACIINPTKEENSNYLRVFSK